MSLAAPSSKRPWLLVGAGCAFLLLVTALLLSDLPDRYLLSSGGSGEETRVTSEGVPQARWKIKTHPAGVLGGVTKAESAQIKRHRPKVVGLVKDVYDALFVDPARLEATLQSSFNADAARALRRSGAAVGLLSTTSRSADIGIQASGRPSFAIATVSLKAVPADRTSRVLAHRSTLWMERSKRGWKVVAFDLQQGPEKPKRKNK